MSLTIYFDGELKNVDDVVKDMKEYLEVFENDENEIFRVDRSKAIIDIIADGKIFYGKFLENDKDSYDEFKKIRKETIEKHIEGNIRYYQLYRKIKEKEKEKIRNINM